MNITLQEMMNLPEMMMKENIITFTQAMKIIEETNDGEQEQLMILNTIQQEILTKMSKKIDKLLMNFRNIKPMKLIELKNKFKRIDLNNK